MLHNVQGNDLGSFYAGDAWSINYAQPNYPNADYDSTVYLTRNGQPVLSIEAEAWDDKFLAEADATETAACKPGTASGSIRFVNKTDATDVATMDIGTIRIYPNPAVAMEPSTAMLALIACEQTIKIIVSQPESSASFNGQQYSLHNLRELYDIRNGLQAEVNGELRDMGLLSAKNYKTILHRFTT